MDLIPIGEGKLKVSMSNSDLSEFGIESDMIDYSMPETKKMLKEILKKAEAELDFTCKAHRTLVQVYTSRSGGCEIFITQLNATTEKNEYCSLHCRSVYDRSEDDGYCGIFAFDKLEYLITVCRRLYEIGYVGNSSAYKGDDKRFYLMLDGLYSPEYSPVDEYSFICEYGECQNLMAGMSYLFEHGKEICASDAIKTLSVL